MMIIFDFGGVLTVHHSTLMEVLLPTLKEHKIPFQFRKLRNLWLKYSSGKKGIGKKFSKIVPKDIEERAMAKVKLKKEVLPLLRYLKRNWYRTAILSNMAGKWAKAMRKKFSLDRYFRPAVFSGYYRAQKPDIRLYKIFVKRAKVKPSDCLYIDNKLVNLMPAHKLGMKTVLFGPRKQKLERCDYAIENLNELKKIL